MITTILKNKFFFAVMIIFIFCFSLVLYLGMKKIYEKEEELRHSICKYTIIISNPMILATLSLFDNENSLRGFFILNVDLLLLFKMIPENISIQTSDRDLIAVNRGTILNKKVPLKKNDIQGSQISSRRVSETETLHYASVQITENQYLTIVKHHHHALLSILFKKIIIQAGIIIVIFLGFVAVLSLSTVSRIKEQIKSNKTLIHALIALTDWRDPETGDHLNRTRKYSVLLAQKIRVSDSRQRISNEYMAKKQRISNEFIANIFEAAPLHDIGKVGIKDSILLKSGKFTVREFEEIKKHVVIGKLIILDLMKRLSGDQPVLNMALNICEYHHEKFDGTGYPEGLAGNTIPLEARIFAVADVYDALRSYRPYKESIDHATVVDIIEAERGKHFDPEVVDAFLECLDKFEAIPESNPDRQRN